MKRFLRSGKNPSWTALLALVPLAAGCLLTGPGRGSKDAQREVFGRSVEGRRIEGMVLGEGNDTCLLFGVIHGNEPLGGPLLELLARKLERNPRLLDRRRVVIVPVLNPDGLLRGSRSNSRGVDLNRNFPANNWKRSPRHGDAPASEPETRALLKIIRQFRPSRILAIHSPLHCVNYDGPAGALAEDMSRDTGYPLRASIGYATPGSLGSYAGEDLLIPTITLELEPGGSEDEIWPRMAGALERFVRAEETGVGK